MSWTPRARGRKRKASRDGTMALPLATARISTTPLLPRLRPGAYGSPLGEVSAHLPGGKRRPRTADPALWICFSREGSADWRIKKTKKIQKNPIRSHECIGLGSRWDSTIGHYSL